MATNIQKLIGQTSQPAAQNAVGQTAKTNIQKLVEDNPVRRLAIDTVVNSSRRSNPSVVGARMDPYTGTWTTDEREELLKQNKGLQRQANGNIMSRQFGGWTRTTDPAAQISENTARVDKINKSLGNTSGNYKTETTATQRAIDRFLGADRTQVTGEKTNWGKIIKGAWNKGGYAFSSGVARTLDFLFGDFAEELHQLGVQTINDVISGVGDITGKEYKGINPGKNVITRLSDKLTENQQIANEYYAQNANTSRAAQVVDRLGTATVAAIPMAVQASLEALSGAGEVKLAGGLANATTQGLNYISSLANGGGVSTMAAQGVKNLLSQPNFWTSYMMVAGDSYEDALQDGFSEDDAAIYAVTNAAFNAMLEVGGADEALGGMQKLPKQLREALEKGNKIPLIQWGKSLFGEGLEEVEQGAFERGLQATMTPDGTLKDFANKWFSLDPNDTSAVINPYTSGEEFVGGAAVGGLLGGGQVITDSGFNAAINRHYNNQMQNALAEQIEAELQKTWGTEDAVQKTTKEYAQIAAKQAMGQKLTPAEQTKLDSKPSVKEAVDTVASKKVTDTMVENAFKDSGLNAAQINVLKDGVELSGKLDPAEAIAETKTAFEQGKTGKLTVEEVMQQSKLDPTVAKHAYQLGAGQQVSAEVADIATEEGKNAVESRLSPLGAQAATAAEVYEPGQDVSTFAAGMLKATQLYAANGANLAEVYEAAKKGDVNDPILAKLTPAQIEKAQEIGNALHAEQVEAAQKSAAELAAVQNNAQELLDAQNPELVSINETIAEAQNYISDVQGKIDSATAALDAMQQADPDVVNTEEYQNMLQTIATQKADIEATQDILNQLKQAQATARAQSQGKRKVGTVTAAEVTLDGKTYAAATLDNLTRNQKRAHAMLNAVADALPVDIVMFSDPHGPFGAYTKGSTIYFNMGREIHNRQGVAQSIAGATMSHELTHYIQQFAPEEYNALRDFVSSEILKTNAEEFRSLVQQQIAIADKNGQHMSYDDAVNEVVANACQNMLYDSEAIKKLARENMNVAERILDTIEEIIGKIKEAFEGLNFSDENMDIFRAVRAVQNQLDGMQKLWDAGIEAAAKNNVAFEATNEAEETGKMAAQAMNWEEDQTLQEHEVQAAVYDALDHADAGDDNLIKVGRMPKFIRDLSTIDGDFYVYRDHLYENIKTEKEAAEEGRLRARGHYHGLGEQSVMDAIMRLESPAVTINDTRPGGNPQIVTVLPVLGPDGTPLVGVLSFYDNEPINGKLSRKPHIVLSVYEKTSDMTDRGKAYQNLTALLDDAVANNRVISLDKEISDGLPVTGQHLKLTSITASSLKNNVAQFQKTVNEFRTKNKINYQNWDGVEDEAVKHFGTTDDYKTAGYILQDGRMLDFSGAHWLSGYDDAYVQDWKRKNDLRQADHEDIYEAFDAAFDNPPSDSALAFIQRGNIRIVPEMPGLELSAKTEPTVKQYAQIRDYVQAINDNPRQFPQERFVVDLTENRRRTRSLMYSGELRADRIINDIKNYYRTGETRDQGLSAFYQDYDEQLEFTDVTRSNQNAAFRTKVAEAEKLTNDVKDFFRKIDTDSDDWLSEDDIDRMMEFDPYSAVPESSSMYEPDGILDRLSEISKDLTGKKRLEVYSLMERLLKYDRASGQQIFTGVEGWLEPKNPEFAAWYNERHPSIYYPGYKPGDLFVNTQPRSTLDERYRKVTTEPVIEALRRKNKARDNIYKEKAYLHELLNRTDISEETRADAQAFLDQLNSPREREIFYQDWDDTYGDTRQQSLDREMSYARLEAEKAIQDEMLQSLQKLTAKQENTIAKLQQRLHLTKDPEVRENDAKKLAKSLLQANDSKADATEIATDLKEIGDYILSGQVNPDELRSKAWNVASKIINAAEVTQVQDNDTITEIRNRINGTKFKISPDETGDIEGYENLNDFRKKNFGRFSIVANDSKSVTPEHQAVDSFYQELRDTYGDYYFPELTNQGEMMKVIADFYDAGEGLTVNPFEQYMGEATEALTNDIIKDALDGIMRPATTDADRWKSRREFLNAQIKDLKKQGALQDKEAARLWDTVADLSLQLDKADSKYKTLQAEANYRAEQLKIEGRQRAVEIRAAEREKAAEQVQALKDYYARMAQKRANTGTRRQIRKMVDDLNARLARPSENKHVPRELVQQTVDVLRMIDYDSGRGGEKFAERIAKIRNMYDSYQNNETYAVAYDEVTAEMLKNLAVAVDGKSLYQMDEQQLDTVYTTLKSMIHVIDNAVKVRIGNEERNAFDVSREMTQETRAIGKEQKGWLRQHFLSAHLRADVAFNRFGGFKKNSAWQAAARMLNDGQLKQTDVHMKLSQPFSELINDDKALREFNGLNAFGHLDDSKLVDIGLKGEDGEAIPVTHDIMVGIYMDLMNEDNRRHFIRSGKTIPNLKDFYTGKGGFGFGSKRAVGISTELSDLNHQLTEANQAGNQELADELKDRIEGLKITGENYADSVKKNIEANLTEYDKKWIQQAKQLMDVDSKNYLNQTTMDVYGIEKANVENYWPITSDPNFLSTPFESITKDASLENVGFMKERVKSGKPTLALGTSQVVNNQINRVAQYSGLMPAIRNFNKIWNKVGYGYSDSLKNSLNATFGKDGTKYVENLLADLTGSRDRGSDTLGVSSLMARLRGNLAQTTLTLNPRVALSQAASFPTAAAELGAKPLAKALAKGGKDGRMISRADQELIEKYSPLLYHRMQGYSSVELGDIKNSQRLSSRVWKKMRWATGWIQAVDGATVGRLWDASKYWVDDNMPSVEKGTDEYYQEVAKKFNDVVEKTQPNYTTMQRAAILRDPNELVKSLTMFMTQRLQNFNILYDAAGSYQKARADFANGRNDVTREDVAEAKAQLVRSVGSQVAQAAVFVGFKLLADALMHNMKAYRDDEEGELTAESVSMQLLDNYIDAVTGTMIGGSELTSIIRAATGKSKWYGLSISGVDSVNDLVNNIMTLATAKYDRSTEKGKAAFDRQLVKIGQSLAQYLGIPASNAIKIKDAIFGHIEDIASGEFGSFNAGFEKTNAQNTATMISALKSGDKTAIADASTAWDDRNKMRSDVKSALKEQYLSGEFGTYEAARLMELAGVRDKDARSSVKKWEFQKQYGFSYDNLKQQYLDGKVSKSTVIDALVTVGGKTRQDAIKTVSDYDFENKYGEEYSEYGLSVSQAKLWYGKYKNQVSLSDYADQVEEYGTTKVKDYYDDWKPQTGMTIAEYDEYKTSAPLYGDDKKIGAYNAWKENLKGTMTLDRYVSILKAADLDLNGSLKQDELGTQLLQAIENGEMTYEQAYKIWHSQGWTKEFDAWAKKRKK